MRLPVNSIGKTLSTSDAVFMENKKNIEALEAQLCEKRFIVRSGRGEQYVARVHQKGKCTTMERIALLIDPNSDGTENP